MEGITFQIEGLLTDQLDHHRNLCVSPKSHVCSVAVWKPWRQAREASHWQQATTEITSRNYSFLSGQSVLKQSANNFFSSDIIPGRYRPLQSARQLGENFCFCKVSKLDKEMFFCCSLHFTVLLMFCFTCFHANQWTMLWINQSKEHFY